MSTDIEGPLENTLPRAVGCKADTKERLREHDYSYLGLRTSALDNFCRRTLCWNAKGNGRFPEHISHLQTSGCRGPAFHEVKVRHPAFERGARRWPASMAPHDGCNSGSDHWPCNQETTKALRITEALLPRSPPTGPHTKPSVWPRDFPFSLLRSTSSRLEPTLSRVFLPARHRPISLLE